MVSRIITLIAISSILALVTNMHGPTYGNLIIDKNDINSKQIQRFYPIASLINNQTTNKEIMTELKSQIENSDPFKIRDADIDTNILNLSSRDDIHSNDVKSNDVKSNDVKSNDDNDCKSDCPEKSKPTKGKIQSELPSIPFP
jgi:hypothetical protein